MNTILKELQKSKIKIIAIISLLMLYIFIAVFFSVDLVTSDQDAPIKTFNDNWIVNDDFILDYIPEKIKVDPGDTFYIANTLPDIKDNEVLQLYSSKADVKVFVSGKLIFHYPDKEEINPINKTLNVPLEKGYSNQEIKIEFKSYYRKYSGRINEIYIGNIENIMDQEINKNLPMFFLFTICIIVGIMIILVFFCVPIHKNYLSWLYLGLFCILLSLRFISEYNLGYLFDPNEILINNIYFCTSLLIPLSLILCMFSVTRHKNLLIFSMLFFMGVSALLILFDYSDYILFSTSLYYYKILCFLSYIIFMFVLFFEMAVYGGTTLITVFLASLVLLLAGAIDYVSHFFYLMSYRNAGLIMGSGLISYMLIMIAVSVYSGVEKIESNFELKNELVEKRIQLMISQIRPHFIYNTLNSIQALISIDPNKSEKMLDDFSKYLRTHIDVIEGDEIILFSEEIENIKAYVNIELVRFPKLSVEYLIEEDLFMVPSLSIQPIVENAIKHGISKKTSGGKVTIASFKKDFEYVIVISDNGVGFDGCEDKSHCSIGIENIKTRLVAMCDAHVEIESKKDVGTIVTIQIPKENENEDDFS
jgi:sensor histidine kinase YesM